MQSTHTWRQGNLLVLAKSNPKTPDRCILTNSPVSRSGSLYRRLTHSKELGSTLVPILYQLTFSLLTMGSVTVEFKISENEKNKRRLIILLGIIMAVTAFSLFCYGIQSGEVPPPFSLIGPSAVLIILSIWMIAKSYMILYIVETDDDFILLRGAGEAFLDSLPEFKNPNQSE